MRMLRTIGGAFPGRSSISTDVTALAESEYPDVDVAIVCESTYPYLKGGLSAVVHQLCEAHPDLSIGIIHITWDRSAPAVPLYDVPAQVAWVMPVYQSIQEHAGSFKAFRTADSGLGRRERAEVVERLFTAIDQHMAGSDEALWRLYDDGINPRTRRFRIWPLLSSAEFMRAALDRWSGAGMSFTDLFWQIREFFSLAFAVTDLHFPKAAVYHSHTTGAAALLAAAAARQQDGRFFLTEHNLYVRDTVNTLLHRGLDTPVTLNEWRHLDEYTTAEFVPRTGRVTPVKRAWMSWFTRSGVVAYRAADLISYLYPEAIAEAAALGGPVMKSHVLPNGVQPSDFDDARADFDSRAAERDGSDHVWRFACAGRVVPIKGQLDLLDALAKLAEDGVGGWQVDIMGPENESPEYVALCKQRTLDLGLEDRVRFLGTVNLRERFGQYDALLLPSHNEGQPIVVLEAMTVGLPTVGTYVGGMKQLVEDDIRVTVGDDPVDLGACGLLVDPHQPAALAAAVRTLTEDPGLFKQFSANGRARVDQYFHLDSAMAMYHAVYSMLASSEAASVDERERIFVQTGPIRTPQHQS